MRDDEPIRPTADLQRVCRDCALPFTVTAGEQAFFLSRQLSVPNRCATCRADRKRAEAYRRG